MRNQVLKSYPKGANMWRTYSKNNQNDNNLYDN